MNDGKMELPALAPSHAMAEVESHRAIQEVQAAMVIAKKFPRDQRQALDRILQACTRPTLAEQALYSYNRGGSDVTGPSIRLAETIAQQWGNIQFGIRELEQRNGESTVEAFAWDVETNTRQVKVFQVPHVRYRRPEKGGSVKLEDPRDVYEMVANQGARRLRACILGVIPGDVIEAAVTQSELTMKTKVEVTPELIQRMLETFGGFGVDKAMIEKYIQRSVESITPALVVRLKKISNSMRDGMSSAADWFQMPAEGASTGQTKERGVGAFMAATGDAKAAPEPGPAQEKEPARKPAKQSGAPSIADVSAMIQKGEFDAAADLARSFPESERKVLEMQIAAAAKKTAV